MDNLQQAANEPACDQRLCRKCIVQLYNSGLISSCWQIAVEGSKVLRVK